LLHVLAVYTATVFLDSFKFLSLDLLDQVRQFVSFVDKQEGRAVAGKPRDAAYFCLHPMTLRLLSLYIITSNVINLYFNA